MPHEQDVPVNVTNEVVKAYYPALLMAGQVARGRAQLAFSMSATIAAALVAGGFFVGIDREPDALRALALAVLTLWLTAAGFYLHAVSTPVEGLERRTFDNGDDFVHAVLSNAKDERDTVGARQGRALVATISALVTTIALIGCLMFRDAPAGAAQEPAATWNAPAALEATTGIEPV